MNLWERLKYLLLPSYRRAQDDEMQEELQSLAALAEPGELGNLTRVAEEGREVWIWTWLDNLYRDTQYAIRTMRQNPGFTATAVLSLALGIGANTAIFSLIDALMLRWLPAVQQPQELVQLKLGSPKDPVNQYGDSFSNAIISAVSERKDIFRNVGGFSGGSFDVGPRGSVSRVHGAWVTGGFYETLGLQPAAGRLLGPDDDKQGAALAVVISFNYWQRQYLANPSAIGQAMLINGHPAVIAGVTPQGYTGANVGAVTDITMATSAIAQLEPAAASLLKPGNFWLRVLARPISGLTFEQAEVRLRAAWPGIADTALSPNWPATLRREVTESVFALTPGGTGHSRLRQQFSKPLLVLMAVAGLVLLIACANVASLLLARASARQREISVRLAIGAGRGRIIRQLLTESTLLSLVGAALGTLLALLIARFLVDTFATGALFGAVSLDLTPNWRVLGFTSAVALANGILFGLAPAFRTTAIGGGSVVLRNDSTRATGSRSMLLSSLVSAQVALSLLLLVGAGLFARTFQNLLAVDPGFRREGVLVVEVDGEREGHREAALTAFYKSLLERVKQVPGIASASLSSHTPLSGSNWSEAAVPKGQPLPERDNATFIGAGPGFFATMQTPLIAGREFEDRDSGKTPNVAIVNQTYAAKFFKGQNPVGQYLSAKVTTPPSDLQIIGVVKDVNTRDLRKGPVPTVYVSYFQRASRVDSLVIRVAGGSLAQAASAIGKELQTSFPTTPLEVRALSDQVEQTIIQERLLANLAGGFGVLGLLLACVGLYGLLGYTVVRRTKEIGIRMALGAGERGVLWMVAGRALRLIAVGVLVGLPVAWIATRWVQSMLFGLSPNDPAVIAGAVAVLAVAGMAAAYVPAQRASRVDPMNALRHD